MPTYVSQPSSIHQFRVWSYGVPTVPPPRPQPTFPQSPPYDRPTSTDSYPCTDPSLRRRPRAMLHKTYSVCSSPIQASQSPARFTSSSPQSSQPSSLKARVNLFTPTQGVLHRAPGPNFLVHKVTNPVGINRDHGVHVPERINCTSTPPHRTLWPTDRSCLLGYIENEYVDEGRDKALPLECLHFQINPRFTERLWHLSKYFFALADCHNDYLKAMFTRDFAPYRIYRNTTSCTFSFVFCIQHKWI